MTSEGMNDLVEDQLINMGNHLLKIHKHKMTANDDKLINLSETNGKLDLAQINVTVNAHCVSFKADNSKEYQVSRSNETLII